MTKDQTIALLRRQNQRLRDENAQLEYYGQLNHNWAVGHNCERMADYERHLKQLRAILKMRKFDNKRFYAYIRREAKKLKLYRRTVRQKP